MENIFLNIHKNDNFDNFGNIFYEVSKELFGNYNLIINDKKYVLTEIEFYYFNTQTHKDLYTHLHCMQLEFNKFYVHEKSANRGGIDFTFGDGTNFGGILIRGLKREDEILITGPAKVRGEITRILYDLEDLKDCEKFYQKYNKSHQDLQEKLSNNIKFEFKDDKSKKDNLNSLIIKKKKRVGLAEKTLCNANIFRLKEYNFSI